MKEANITSIGQRPSGTNSSLSFGLTVTILKLVGQVFDFE
jgi:hypothetical protein